ncbi:MAG: beta-glucosidase BglX [Gemmatimonadota bacterium]|nr:beta-glucosidase BglX [Gemmatimonadota bacterium]
MHRLTAVLRPAALAFALSLLAASCASPGAGRSPSPSPAASTVTFGVGRDPAETRFVDSLLALMTVEEKLGQLNQISNGPDSATRADLIRQGRIGSFLNVAGADTTRRLQRVAVEQSRLRIPLLFSLDVIHGFRTIYPVPLGEAASWDPAMAERTARMAAVEAAAAGLHWTFAPMVDIARDPRWGRVVEGAGEDPYLGNAFAAARVHGFQGWNLRDRSAIAATAKHFAGYGAAEGGRDYNTAELSERTLREVYLPPFHAASCAGAMTFMAGFNDIAGVPDHASPHLLTDILRREWGFDGLVVSDWTGIAELVNHGVGADQAAVGKVALDAGVDVDMVSEIYVKALPALVRDGTVSMATLDEAVRRMLRLKYRLGLFADPYRAIDPARERAAMLTAENRSLARDAARRSIVLLKNDGGVLPLSKEIRTLAVIGALAADSAASIGNWSAFGRREDAVSVLTGIRRAVSAGTTVRYARGASPESDDTTGIAQAVSLARGADAVVLVIGETPAMSAEASSRASIELPGAQLRLAQAVKATGVPVVVVLMNGRPLATQWLHDNVPAIVETWFLGTEHGSATADVLFGDANPGGHLPITVPRVTGQVPIYYAHRNTGRPPSVPNKYSSKYLDVSFEPLYVFGHGLSYTTFAYGAPTLSTATMRPGDTLRVHAEVTNTGRVAGEEVVQLYLRDEVASIARPVRELKGFRRVLLAPGERRTVQFTLDVRDLAFYDADMRHVAEPGAFRVFVGGSSAATRDARFTLETPGKVPVPVEVGCPALR